MDELVELLRACLPIVEADVREWFEDVSEADNRRRQAESRDLADRIRQVIPA